MKALRPYLGDDEEDGDLERQRHPQVLLAHPHDACGPGGACRVGRGEAGRCEVGCGVEGCMLGVVGRGKAVRSRLGGLKGGVGDLTRVVFW